MKSNRPDESKKHMKEEGHKDREYAHHSGVKIVINVGDPQMPVALPVGKPPRKLLKKRLKKLSTKGPMEAALSEACC